MHREQKLNPHTALTRETGLEADYILNPDHGRVWIHAEEFSACVGLQDNGVIVRLFHNSNGNIPVAKLKVSDVHRKYAVEFCDDNGACEWHEFLANNDIEIAEIAKNFSPRLTVKQIFVKIGE